MTKKKSLSTSRLKELGEFENIIDLIEEDSKSKKSKLTEKDESDTQELNEFLKIEHDRLKKMFIFFTDKISNFIKTPQTRQLLKIQKANTSKVKNQVRNHIKDVSSNFNLNLASIWNSSYFYNENKKENTTTNNN